MDGLDRPVWDGGNRAHLADRNEQRRAAGEREITEQECDAMYLSGDWTWADVEHLTKHGEWVVQRRFIGRTPAGRFLTLACDLTDDGAYRPATVWPRSRTATGPGSGQPVEARRLTDTKPIAEMTDEERLAAPYVRDPALLPIGADPDGPRPYDPSDPRQRSEGRPTAAEDRAARDVRLRKASALLGRQLRTYRAAHGLTQRDVAERLGWDQPTVARLEAGLVSPNLATLALLGERLDVRVVLAPEAGGMRVTLEPLEPVAGAAS